MNRIGRTIVMAAPHIVGCGGTGAPFENVALVGGRTDTVIARSDAVRSNRTARSNRLGPRINEQIDQRDATEGLNGSWTIDCPRRVHGARGESAERDRCVRLMTQFLVSRWSRGVCERLSVSAVTSCWSMAQVPVGTGKCFRDVLAARSVPRVVAGKQVVARVPGLNTSVCWPRSISLGLRPLSADSAC